MDQVIEISNKNVHHREEVSQVAQTLSADAQTLKKELSKFKI